MRAAAACLGLALAFPFDPACASEPPSKSNDLIVRYVVDKRFSDVIFELNFAITEQNLRITGRNTIGESLRERGYENFPDVEVIHFCSLELAREVLILDPGFVAHMPCRIAVHEQDGKTVISLITLPLDHPDPRVNQFARRMNAILKEIVGFTLDSDGD
jgi:uncharacterized protein (DUF302 family)